MKGLIRDSMERGKTDFHPYNLSWAGLLSNVTFKSLAIYNK